MEDNEDFVDFYALLQVDPFCERSIVEKAYRHFAQLYHPDHSDTADVDKFQEVTRAYKVLKDTRKRAEYDRAYAAENGIDPAKPQPRDDIVVDGSTAVEDAEIHEKLLLALYKRRREKAGQPGVMPYHIQNDLDCSDESFDFHIWYLKSKGFIEITQESELAITIEGVDHVISRSRAEAKEKLFLEQARRDEAE
ncbi:MAG: DnaJ domain-containing protein [Erythrobacter sp.]|nr:DnaJ domain-containing protein [Erythrobacter sp.]